MLKNTLVLEKLENIFWPFSLKNILLQDLQSNSKKIPLLIGLLGNQRKKIKCPTIDDVFSFLKLVWLWPLCDILVPCFIHFPVYRMEFPHSVCSKHEHKVSLLYILLFDKTMYGEFKSFTYFLSDGYLFEVSDIFIRIQRVLIYYLLLYLNRKI